MVSFRTHEYLQRMPNCIMLVKSSKKSQLTLYQYGSTFKDIVWFRTSVPGHKDCDAENLSPFKTYDEYVPTITEVYSWDKFIDYNDYASRVIRERSKKNNLKGPAIDILDVYPMTVLRPDGHAGGADCVNCGRDDCLHYSLPGPVDWWNHLMLSNLVDTASRG